MELRICDLLITSREHPLSILRHQLDQEEIVKHSKSGAKFYNPLTAKLSNVRSSIHQELRCMLRGLDTITEDQDRPPAGLIRIKETGTP